MNVFFSLLPALLAAFACILALIKGVDIYSAMLTGAEKGLKTVRAILPGLLCLFPAAAFMRSSGAAEALTEILTPVLKLLRIPEETAILLLLRPLSGSAAMSGASGIMSTFGADSVLGRTAAVMLGASETTFYVISVYFSAAGIKDSRWAIPAALAADLACFVSSAWIVKLMWG